MTFYYLQQSIANAIITVSIIIKNHDELSCTITREYLPIYQYSKLRTLDSNVNFR